MHYSQTINFPDTNFKNAILNNTYLVDSNHDGEIQVSEAESFAGYLNVKSKNISDLTGIEYFINLISLNCSLNSLSNINISNNLQLTTLYCYNNNLTSIDLSDNVELLYVNCSYNNLTSIDINTNIHLFFLDCSWNNIASITLNQNIEELHCNNNYLIELNVSNLQSLHWLFCAYNTGFQSLNISGCESLWQLNIEGSPLLTGLDLSNTPSVLALELTQNGLTSLDVTNLPNLEELYCGGNYITSIDLSQNPNLGWLGVEINNLSTLDVSNNTQLKQIWCHTNAIEELDVSVLNQLKDLVVYNTPLAFLDIRNNNNINFDRFWAWNTPNLSCIFVDNAEWSNANWSDIDPNSTFVETEQECEALDLEEITILSINIYPNPFVDSIEIDDINQQFTEISFYNEIGQKILSTTNKTIDTKNFQNGFYIVKIKLRNGTILSKKLIKI